MIKVYYKSTGDIFVTVTDADGVGVDSADVSITISLDGADLPGVAWPWTLAGYGGGVYKHALADNILDARKVYKAKITAYKLGVQRYAEIPVHCLVDFGD